MSKWPGKYVIGLTGNIATGKSVVRKMLEHLGAVGIDADSIAHRAITTNAPGYKPVVQTFGKYILAPDGQIDRSRLGKLVFSDPEALGQLEMIVHPLVIEAINLLVSRSSRNVVVIEAIKLMESGLAEMCDSIWVSSASQEQQIARLMSKRGMTQTMALQRINAQPPQDQKIALADVVINNEGSFEEAWRQVKASWERLVPPTAADATSTLNKAGVSSVMTVERARPHQAEEIAAFITHQRGLSKPVSQEEMMASFGEKSFLLVRQGDQICGLAGWKIENLVACTDDLLFDKSVDISSVLNVLIGEIERVSRELLCEISLVFTPFESADCLATFVGLGYHKMTVDSLDVLAWREAAEELAQNGSIMLFKQLRNERVMRPV